MKYIACATAALLCQLGVAQPLPDHELAQYIDSQVAAGGYVGMIVGYFDETGTYIQGFGRISKESTQAPNQDTVFEISSVSKTFAATLLADAVVRQEMSLDDVANDHFEPGVRLTPFEGHAIRLIDLAQHRSGLPNRPETFTPGTEPNPYGRFSENDLLDAINDYAPTSAAGSEYGYSAFAYAVLALALSTRLEAPFEELVRRRLTAPLGMIDTVAALNEQQASRLATGYTPEGSIAEPLDQGAFRAAGSMYSTLRDLMVWTYLHAKKPDSRLGRAARLTQVLRDDAQIVSLAWHRTEGYGDFSQYGTANGYRAFVGFLADGSKGAVVLANTQANVQDVGARLLLRTSIPE